MLWTVRTFVRTCTVVLYVFFVFFPPAGVDGHQQRPFFFWTARHVLAQCIPNDGRGDAVHHFPGRFSVTSRLGSPRARGTQVRTVLRRDHSGAARRVSPPPSLSPSPRARDRRARASSRRRTHRHVAGVVRGRAHARRAARALFPPRGCLGGALLRVRRRAKKKRARRARVGGCRRGAARGERGVWRPPSATALASSLSHAARGAAPKCRLVCAVPRTALRTRVARLALAVRGRCFRAGRDLSAHGRVLARPVGGAAGHRRAQRAAGRRLVWHGPAGAPACARPAPCLRSVAGDLSC